MIKRIKHILKGMKETILHFGLISLIIIPVFILLNTLLYIGINIQEDIINTSLQASANSELSNITLFVNARIDALHDDVHVIVNANETNEYLHDQSINNLNQYQAMLYRIMESKESFIHINIIEPTGDIVYEIERQSHEILTTTSGYLGSIASEAYYQSVLTMDEGQIFVSTLYLNEGQPMMTYIKPLYMDDTLITILSIEVSAHQILSVIENYADEHIDFLHIGLINHHTLWSFDMNQQLIIFTDLEEINAILNRIDTNDYTISEIIDFNDEQNHFVTLDDNELNFYVDMHYQEAVNASSYYLLRFPWLIAIINLVLLGFISVIANLVKSRNDDKILTNANIYLSEQSSDAVVVTSFDSKITYTNQAFLRNYEYHHDEVIHQNLDELISMPALYPNYDKSSQKEYIYFNWTKTRSNIYLLRHLRIKRESAVRKSRRHYIYVYSEPKIELDDYQKYITKKEETLITFRSLLGLEPLIINQTIAIMFKLDETDTIKFAEYIMLHCHDINIVAQVKHNYLLLYLNHATKSFEQIIDELELLLERYRYLPYVGQDFSHLFVASKADEHINTIDKLMDSLILSLEIARSNPQNPHVIYDERMHEQIEREREIRNELFNAFTNDEFYMVYQPQMHLRTKRFFGVESLLRWQNEKLGFISPAEFIPIIENSYFVNQLTAMVLKKVIRDFEPYRNQLPKKFRISINITAFDFKDYDMVMHLIEIIEESELPSDRFIFEITESHYIDNIEKTNHMVDLLHAKGILIAIDDFGTGYSSINSLKSIKIDLVKLDRSFIKDYPNADNGDMVKTIINLIHGLKKTVIVEGTETQAHMDFCDENHCEYVQGYYVSKPVSISEVMKIITS